MKISVSLYTLEGKDSFKDRQGALLRIENNDKSPGYCDVHPWPELGDKPLNEQLSLLRQGIKTSLTQCSLKFAEVDSIARASEKNIFSNLKIPPSHWLVKSADEAIPEKFSIIKIKADPSAHLKEWIKTIPLHLKIRIDFNNKHTFETFSRFINSIREYWDRIDFIEDPFPYDKKQWESMPVPLAGDFQDERGPIVIAKPAVDDIGKFTSCKRLVVTSYLDHPLGQLGAAYTAATKMPNKSEVCGLLSHLIYEKNCFSERLHNNGPDLIIPSEGTGFGFDDLLENLSWKLL
jgi:O-succinylbenzoate synthase